MNRFLKRLFELSQADARLVVGLMSGTSLDGLDIALCRFTGCGLATCVEVLHAATFPYSEDFKQDLRSVFSKREVDLEKVTLLNAKIGEVHGDQILRALKDWGVDPSAVNFIASHGQTIYHAPKRFHGLTTYPNATLQIGDGDHIAFKTGIITISDFRQKHLAAGAEGAPLALYGDYILFSSSSENRVLLNIGGISNFTYLPALQSGGIICSDIGPGNTMIDLLTKKYFNIPFDDGGQIAARGKVCRKLLAELIAHPFFHEPLPKTTGPELFNTNYLEAAIINSGSTGLAAEDLITTVTQFTAEAIAKGIKEGCNAPSLAIYASGGGSHNQYLINSLRQLLPQCKIDRFESLGVSADAKEAVLFAVLANETVCGSKVDTGAGPAVTMGKISLPD
ncbi:anhydro-N-acetylmuramic acid kinase [Desertivirga brevis]|uniref:anhydro-N-acetylmuramic acid kinase n=1 Tax=Desertivirga brevis TaxID=2810310 RepID=UPI001A956F0A|nr:anhydro-N-acetylmuramic acid kinase [Pedobacter sp. SYSU D00873]